MPKCCIMALAALAPVSAVKRAAAEEPEASRAVARCEHSKLITQDADPLGAGAWQVQFNFALSRSAQTWNANWDGEHRGHTHTLAPQVVVTYGLLDTLDLAAGMGYACLKDRDNDPPRGRGATDLALSAKWRFWENEAAGLALAYVPTLTVPTGKDTTSRRLRPGQGFWTLDNRVALVKDWSERLSTNFDVGYTAAFGGRGGARGSFSANAAVGYRLSDCLQPEAELNYVRTFARRGDDSELIAVTLGLVMPLSDRFCLRGGVQQGIAGRNTDKVTTTLLSLDVNF